MAELWKAWKAKSRLPPPPTAPWKSRTQREIPTFPQPRRGALEKWKTKNRFPTFPFRLATTNSVFFPRNAAAFGRRGSRFAANRTPSRSPDSKSKPNGRELFPGLQHLMFPGSSCIGNESRFQDHPSIGICSGGDPGDPDWSWPPLGGRRGRTAAISLGVCRR
jgi:hypothetical protein